MGTNGAITKADQASKYELALVSGDLSQLSANERLSLYTKTCESLKLNPLTKPFEFINLNGKLTFYAKRDCTDQLRKNNSVSVRIVSREQVGDLYVVTAQATMPDGRTDESIGAVAMANLKGDAQANAMMKCETKAKRRVTLSICGLGIMDESELETVKGAKTIPFDEAISADVVTAVEIESEDEQIARWTDAINGAVSLDALARLRKEFAAEKPGDAVKLAISIVYNAKKKELEEGAGS